MSHFDTLYGQDLGVIAGATGAISPGGIFLYVPISEVLPHPDMTNYELRSIMSNVSRFANIPYQVVRSLHVDQETVWRNRDEYDLEALQIDPFDQVYWGRGNVAIEFRNNVEGVERVIEEVLKRPIDLHSTKSS